MKSVSEICEVDNTRFGCSEPPPPPRLDHVRDVWQMHREVGECRQAVRLACEVFHHRRAPSLSQSPPQNHDNHPSEARARDPSISLPSAAAIMRAFGFARFRSEPVLKEHYSPPDANQSAQKAYSKHRGTPAEFHIPVNQCDEEHSRVEPGRETVTECRYAIVRSQINAALPFFVEVVLTAHVLRLPHVPVGGESEPQAACIEPCVGRGRPCVPHVGAHRELRDVCPGEFGPAERLVAAAGVGGD
jgi:hypothetical protein